VAKGGNHLFPTAVGADDKGQPVINLPALEEIGNVFKGDLLSEFFVGLAKGYLDDQRSGLQGSLAKISPSARIEHPVETIRSFSAELEKQAEKWLA
jgi:CRISPR-associated protein Cst2